jgi:SAM-dependent methyltransferase
VPPYRQLSAFYDAVMDDPGPRADRVNAWIDRFRPGAASLLELGCGTGSILERIVGIEALTGLDRSPEMLAIARSKVPAARLVEGDMATFSLGETFDVVVSVFDSINHLLSFEAWRSMFAAVHDHLSEGGLFIFDVNTVGELRRLGDEPPWVYEFEGGVMIMDVAFAEDGLSSCLSRWDVKIFEHLDGATYRLHHEEIDELGVNLSRIREALAPRFVLLRESDEHGNPPTDTSVKAHFAFGRRPGPPDGAPEATGEAPTRPIRRAKGSPT